MEENRSMNVILNFEEIKSILSALDYQDSEFETYDDPNENCWEIRCRLKQLIDDRLDD